MNSFDRELASQNIQIYPPNKKGEPWIAVKFGLAGPRSTLEAFGVTEQLALSALRLRMNGHWIVLEEAS